MPQLSSEALHTKATYSHSGCHPGLYFHAGIPASEGINGNSTVSSNSTSGKSHANNDGIQQMRAWYTTCPRVQQQIIQH
jgi:hypothetical protein